MPFLFDLASFSYLCYPCRCLYVSTRACRGDLRGAVRHRARGSRGFCFDYLSRQGGELVPLLYNFLLLPSYSLRTYCLILSTLYAMLKTHTTMNPHNPASHCTASVTLLSHCLVWIEDLLLTP